MTDNTKVLGRRGTGSAAISGAKPPALFDTVLAGSASAYLALLYFRPMLALVVGELAGPTNVLAAGVAFWSALMSDPAAVIGRRGAHIKYLVAATLVVAAASLANSSSGAAISSALYTVAATWMTYVVFIVVGQRPKVLRIALLALASCALINAAVGAWGAATGQTLLNVSAQDVGTGAFGFDAETGRSGGVVGENYVGMFDLPALVIGYRWLSRGRGYRLLGLGAIALGAIAIGVSYSRTSVVSGATAVFVAISIYAANARRARVAVATAIVIAGAAAALRISAVQLEEVNHFARDSMSTRWSMQGVVEDVRLKVWESYAETWLGSPLLGEGPGFIAGRVAAGEFVPHNSLIDVLVEYGALGALVFLWPFATTFRLMVRRRRRYGSAERVFVPIVVGMSVTLATLSNPFARILWACMGALAGGRAQCIRAERAPARYDEGARVTVV